MEKVAVDWSSILPSKNAAAQLCRIERDEPDIRERLYAIYQAYISECMQKKLETVRGEIQKELWENPYIYRYTSRVKDPQSILGKIISKIYSGSGNYLRINSSNYDKLLTDLIGVRLIHKFPDEWVWINRLIYDLYYKGDEFFVRDYITDYTSSDDSAFLIEKPLIYHLPNEDLSMYRAAEQEAGRSLFCYIPKENYRSVHYLVNFHGVYIEIQVRTLSDELWNDIEHDLVYKQNTSILQDQLKSSSTLLRYILSAADDVGMYMKLLADGKRERARPFVYKCTEEISRADNILIRLKGEERNASGDF